jgi:hypothetical protein
VLGLSIFHSSATHVLRPTIKSWYYEGIAIAPSGISIIDTACCNICLPSIAKLLGTTVYSYYRRIPAGDIIEKGLYPFRTWSIDYSRIFLLLLTVLLP